MFTTDTAQDFDPAIHATRCITRNCNVVAGYKDAGGLLEEEQPRGSWGSSNMMTVTNGPWWIERSQCW